MSQSSGGPTCGSRTSSNMSPCRVQWCLLCSRHIEAKSLVTTSSDIPFVHISFQSPTRHLLSVARCLWPPHCPLHVRDEISSRCQWACRTKNVFHPTREIANRQVIGHGCRQVNPKRYNWAGRLAKVQRMARSLLSRLRKSQLRRKLQLWPKLY